MANGKRVTPFKQKARRGRDDGKNALTKQIKIDSVENRAKIELMTIEEMTRVQQVAAQNALTLFNNLIEEVQKRIPTMSDEVLASSLLSVWSNVGRGKR